MNNQALACYSDASGDELAGKVALVTGAACPPGLGRAVALDLARRGAQVACAERVVEDGDDGALPDSACATAATFSQVVAEVEAAGTEALGLEVDVADAAAPEEAVAAVLDRFGRLDVCVNVEGGLGPGLGHGPLLELERSSWERCLTVNLTAAWAVAVAAARPMVASGSGSIVLVSSYASRGAPQPDIGAFAVAKAGVDRMTRDLADELGPHGVRVNGVRPLGVDPEQALGRNPFLEQVTVGDRSAAGSWADRNIAQGRYQAAEETAAVVGFLVSDRASFVTGEVVNVTGGARY